MALFSTKILWTGKNVWWKDKPPNQWENKQPWHATSKCHGDVDVNETIVYKTDVEQSYYDWWE